MHVRALKHEPRKAVRGIRPPARRSVTSFTEGMPSVLDLLFLLAAGASVCTACAAGSFRGATGKHAYARATS
jgi:hypothetical protein